uniref:Putative RNA binding protein rggm n=1 Tax=Leishmania guyanensis TaxID=5670 RepID=A0A1E1J4G2_LEIGU
MLRRSFAPLLTRASAVCLQGWGSTSGGGGWGGADTQASGGWGSAGDSTSSGGGWGSAGDSTSSGGGWGSAGDSASSSQWGSKGDRGSRGFRGRGRESRGKSGWGSKDRSDGWGGDGGSWGDVGNSSGGWGGDGGSRGGGQAGWGGDGGWRDAPTGGRGMRGSFRRGRGGSGSGGGVWGQPAAADEDAWNAAPPSFQPPVRRVDPLTLTAVEVEVDGVKKLVGQRVQVSGLSDETTWHTLKDHLRQAGDITFCRLFSGGRGMVEFAVPEDAARCITELQGSELEGATLYLREDREDTVLINTRRKIRDARDAQLRARKEEAEKVRRERAMAQGDVSSDSAVQ